MGAVFCFLLFLAAVGLCILLGQSLILAIWVGIAAFAALGLRRGMTVRAMWDAAWEQGRKMCCVIVIYMLIGAITALWRSAGTIAFFIYHGLRIITPQLFLLVTFLLTSFISYALGTSFGVVGRPWPAPAASAWPSRRGPSWPAPTSATAARRPPPAPRWWPPPPIPSSMTTCT